MLLGQLSVNPQQLICVLYATRTPTNCKFICCKKTTQKKLYKCAKLVYYMHMLNITQQQNKMQNATKKLTNAQLVRDNIALVKNAQSNATLAQQQQSVVQWAVANLAMQKQLARVYVANNWSKVTV